MFRFFSLLAIATLLLGSTAVWGDDWPQILGPHRQGEAVDENLAESWPKAGPNVEWTHTVGDGFAGPAVVAEVVVIFHRVDDNERIEALSTKSGKRLWKADFPASYVGRINPDSGPRCVPIIDQSSDSVFAFGASGDLYCVSLSSGKTKWTRSTYEDFGGDDGYFGAGSTPILIADLLLVNVGGRNGAGIVAFSPDTGKTVWKATDESASYSSPTMGTIAGKPAAVFVTRMNVVVIDPHNGKVFFQTPFGKRGPTVNAATPQISDGKLFVTSSYGVGAKLIDLHADQPKTLWENDDILSSQYNTPVINDGTLFGIHGREDIGVAELRCVDLRTGKINWSQRDFGVAHILRANDKLLILKNNGQAILAEANSQKFAPLATAEIFTDTVRAIPAIANGKLYARDSKTLKCLNVGK